MEARPHQFAGHAEGTQLIQVEKTTLATVSGLKAKADLFLPPSVHTNEKAESPAPLPLAGPAVGIAIHRWEALQ